MRVNGLQVYEEKRQFLFRLRGYTYLWKYSHERKENIMSTDKKSFNADTNNPHKKPFQQPGHQNDPRQGGTQGGQQGGQKQPQPGKGPEKGKGDRW